MALWIDNAGFTLRDDNYVGPIGMVEDDVAGGHPSQEIANPWFSLTRVESHDEPLSVFVCAVLAERYGHRAVWRQTG